MSNVLSKAERTRNFIIESTAEIFNKKGYAGTSLNDLTAATGLTKGSIYGNFENKEEVALAAFDYNHACVTRLIGQRIEQADSFRDKLLVYASVYDNFNKGNFPLGGCPVLNTAVEADDTHDQLKKRAAGAVLSWKKNIELLIAGGIASKEFKPDLDSSMLALSMIALIEGGIMIAKVTGSQRNMDQVMQTLKMLVDQMLATT